MNEISHSHTKDITHFSPGSKMYNSIVLHIAYHVQRQDISAQVRHSDGRGQSGSIARNARSALSGLVSVVGCLLVRGWSVGFACLLGCDWLVGVCRWLLDCLRLVCWVCLVAKVILEFCDV